MNQVHINSFLTKIKSKNQFCLTPFQTHIYPIPNIYPPKILYK